MSILAGAMALVSLLPLQPAAAGPHDGRLDIGPSWTQRIDPWSGVPSTLALRFGRAAVAGGLTPRQAAGLLNDSRFVAAVGAADQGWGLLEALVDQPAAIVDAHMLLQAGTYTLAGATSFQYAFLSRHPELRNAYLSDLGHMIALRSDGVEVLVDIETGSQIIGRDLLGIPVRAPGGAPLPTPSITPEDAAAQMWDAAGIDPHDPSPGAVAAASPLDAPRRVGSSLAREGSNPGLFRPGVYFIAAAFVASWLGFAALMLIRRLRRD